MRSPPISPTCRPGSYPVVECGLEAVDFSSRFGYTGGFAFRTWLPESFIIATRLTQKEQDRFHNLLKLAAESPYEGERVAALLAAERLVAKHGMTLDEAAQRDPVDWEPEPTEAEKVRREAEQESIRRAREEEIARQADKSHWERAWKEARARGLDEAAAKERERAKARTYQQPRSRRRRNPIIFANTLLAETGMSLKEIADITQLDIYQVAGLKLKLRKPQAA